MTKVTLRTGSEGPPHDPYHFDELTVERRNSKTVIHLGLAVWCQHNKGTKVNGEEYASALFEAHVGMPWHVVLKSLRKLEERKAKALWLKHRHCPGDARRVAGYPGERFTLCGCGEVIDYSFNRSEVE